MIKQIKVYNRLKMDKFLVNGHLYFPYKNQPWYLISIYDTDGAYLVDKSIKTLKQMGFQDGISLYFWDLIPGKHDKVIKRYPEATFFNKDHAKQIIKFIDNIQKQDDSVLVVHCSAGISRSGAVGVFASDYCGLEYKRFISDNPYVMANPHVLSLLRRESGMVPRFKDHDGINHELDGKIIVTKSED